MQLIYTHFICRTHKDLLGIKSAYNLNGQYHYKTQNNQRTQNAWM